MLKIINRNKIMLLIIVLLLVFCTTAGLLTMEAKAQAADEPVWEDSVVIAHITDTHYYPLRYCDSDYGAEFKKHVQKTSTKMWLEAELAFFAAVEGIKEQKPDYLVVSGDIAQDGERQAHIDVANGLRALQNEIRQTKPHFQVFVAMGNHDLYNEEVFDFSTGTKEYTQNVSRKDITKIYSSLGYPDLSNEDAAAFYSTSEYNGDTPAYAFVNSTTAGFTQIEYQYKSNETNSDYAPGEITYIAKTATGETIIGLDVPISNSVEGHVLGGTLTKATQAFLTAKKAHTDYAVGIAHHSIVEHLTLQKELMTGFIVTDHINSADFLADYGMRYVFTGHGHANDIAHHISFNNNQITDIEGSANLSTSSNVRYATIKSGTLGETKVQNFSVWSDYLTELDISAAIDGGYMPQEYIITNKVQEFITDKKITDYSAYARRRIYDNITDNTIKAYLNPSILSGLGEMVGGVLPDWLSSVSEDIDTLVLNLVDEIEKKILTDYTYSGDNELLKEHKLFGFVEELVYRAINIEVAPNTTTFDLVMTCYYYSIKGSDAPTFADLPSNIQQGIEYARSGGFVKELFDVLLDEEKGLYFLVEGIMNMPLDLSKDVDLARLFKSVIGPMLGFNTTDDPLEITNILLSKVVTRFLSSDLSATFGIDFAIEGDVMDFLDSTIEDFLTPSLYTGLGELVANILVSLAVDSTPDGGAESQLIKLSASDEYTYTSVPRADVPTIQNGKLPSKLTVAFGEDTSTTKNFNWFTDMRISDSVVQYMKKSDGAFDAAKAVTKSGNTNIYGYTVGLIDIGLFAQLGYTEAARHTVEVTGLAAGTEYWYRVGSSEYGYFSPVYSFKTAPSSGAFEVLLLSDLQGFTNGVYENIAPILAKADSVFKNGYDFVINGGDTVDNARNVTQFDYFLNTLSGYWGNTTQVVTNGNHESYYFEMDEDYEASSDTVVTNEYNYLLMHYNFALPQQDTKSGAYYSFDYSGVHFIVLNTNDIEENKLSNAQFDWLKADLEDTQKEHKVIIMHKSLYSAGSHTFDTEIVGMREQLSPVFEENDVHLVLSGHDHTYSETYYLDGEGNKVVFANNGRYKIGKKGTLYVNLGTLGNKFYKYQAQENIPVFNGEKLHDPALRNPTFGKLVYDGKDLYYQGYEYDVASGEILEIKTNKLNAIEITLVVVGSVVGAAGIAIGVIVLLKLKKKSALKMGKELPSDEPKPDEPTAEEPITEEPITEEPTTEEPITEEPITEEPKEEGKEE